jgi:hypothetical protein
VRGSEPLGSDLRRRRRSNHRELSSSAPSC